ncbi:MAG: hypothetical protein KDD40_01905 [Bdellovibrionales bacterium]|nr:hypothetical protein [Bdellovibrionales bacterium]
MYKILLVIVLYWSFAFAHASDNDTNLCEVALEKKSLAEIVTVITDNIFAQGLNVFLGWSDVEKQDKKREIESVLIDNEQANKKYNIKNIKDAVDKIVKNYEKSLVNVIKDKEEPNLNNTAIPILKFWNNLYILKSFILSHTLSAMNISPHREFRSIGSSSEHLEDFYMRKQDSESPEIQFFRAMIRRVNFEVMKSTIDLYYNDKFQNRVQQLRAVAAKNFPGIMASLDEQLRYIDRDLIPSQKVSHHGPYYNHYLFSNPFLQYSWLERREGAREQFYSSQNIEYIYPAILFASIEHLNTAEDVEVNSEIPSFENTVKPLVQIGKTYTQASLVLQILGPGVNYDPSYSFVLERLANLEYELRHKVRDKVLENRKILMRVQQVEQELIDLSVSDSLTAKDKESVNNQLRNTRALLRNMNSSPKK